METVPIALEVLIVLVQMVSYRGKKVKNVRHVMLDSNLEVNLEYVKMSTNVNWGIVDMEAV